MALLIQLLRRQQRRREKAFKIGYYRHLAQRGLLDLGASESFAIKGVRLETGCKDLCSLLSTHPYIISLTSFFLLSLPIVRGADTSGSFTSSFLSLS